MKIQTIQAKNVKPRVQFAYLHDGKPCRATIYQSAPNVYTLRFRDHEGEERLVELRGDVKVGLSYDAVEDLTVGVQRCSKHGLKIQRPRGEFDCETCFREYGQRARAAAKARKAAAAAGAPVRIETQAERAQRLKDEETERKVTRLMKMLEAQGKALWQQPEPDYSHARTSA